MKNGWDAYPRWLVQTPEEVRAGVERIGRIVRIARHISDHDATIIDYEYSDGESESKDLPEKRR